ncbi:hypothetical protein [Streptomyces benahoarensis]|uniref:Uncharacterized protein n=1 Tax=Streptomyces benahoarensis TaxID=2595054 RepID=A0A553ZMM9_9ACTN|nr:hypothetical protein [Streptomyces benahoarensis]TSB32008.1 hypothetical protein FNJ62_03775 [Streptomyces benahoarensis]TSB42734.1 hypothetical protein FNZ23_08320 [Streptomyces benahoarensis]
MHALLLAVLAAIAGTAWYWNRFPGKWVFPFSPEYADRRAQLTKFRRNLRAVDKEAAQAERSARERANAEEAKYQQDVRELENEIAGLLRPGTGRCVKGPIGDITVYEHAVKMAGQTPAVIQLAGLKAEFRSDPTYMIDLTEPSGRTHRARYPSRREADGEETPFFTAEQLSDFTLDILNAAADEHDFRTHREARLPHARKELETAQRNTASRDEALKNLQNVCAWQKNNPRRKTALAELDEERRRWQQLTGKMPPR